MVGLDGLVEVVRVDGVVSRVVKFSKVPFINCFSTDFCPKVTDLPSVFHLTSIWSCKAASKSEAVKSTLLNKSCSNQKILADLLYQL